jgi:hypothetical protein
VQDPGLTRVRTEDPDIRRCLSFDGIETQAIDRTDAKPLIKQMRQTPVLARPVMV